MRRLPGANDPVESVPIRLSWMVRSDPVWTSMPLFVEADGVVGHQSLIGGRDSREIRQQDPVANVARRGRSALGRSDEVAQDLGPRGHDDLDAVPGVAGDGVAGGVPAVVVGCRRSSCRRRCQARRPRSGCRRRWCWDRGFVTPTAAVAMVLVIVLPSTVLPEASTVVPSITRPEPRLTAMTFASLASEPPTVLSGAAISTPILLPRLRVPVASVPMSLQLKTRAGGPVVEHHARATAVTGR